MVPKIILYVATVSLLLLRPLYADKLTLKERPGGNEAEVLKETSGYFVVRIPKDEIESIVRKKASEVELWKQKRIIWEDSGDYLVISIPKERVSNPGGASEGLEEALSDTGAQKTKTSVSGEGSIIKGAAIKGGRPLSGCVVKIVMVQPAGTGLSSMFGRKKAPEEGKGVFTTISDEDGKYEFRNVPAGAYDIYWRVSSKSAWIRKLSDKPNIIAEPGQEVRYPDIIIR